MVEMPMWVPSFLTSEESEDDLPLREFIYLDEVSVVSLLSSLTREVTEERTDIDMTEKQSRSGLKATLSFIPGINPGANLERVSTDRDTEEVVRRSEIQSKFDELYSETSPYFELENEDVNTGVSVSDLSEGGVMEVKVEFSGHELFHYYKAFQYLIDVVEGAEYEFDEQEKQMIELMGSLFGDQIPVVGRLLNYQLVDGQIRKSKEIGDEEGTEDLWIVGALDPDMLWQDPSQFLYDDNKFKAYVRLPETRIQNDWDPLKLTRVIRSISEPIGDQLSGMIDGAFTEAKQEFDTANLGEEEQANVVSDYHDEYFDFVEEDSGLELSENRREELLVSAYREVIAHPDESDYEFEVRLLKEVADLVEEQDDVSLDRDMLAQQRSKLLDQQPDDGTSVSDSSNRNYLEVSFVAVYW